MNNLVLAYPIYLILHVRNGDTFDCIVDLGFKVKVDIAVRLARVNTAEMGARGSVPATRFTSIWFARNEGQIWVETHKVDKYGRWIGEVYVPDGENLSDLLLAERLAVPYP